MLIVKKMICAVMFNFKNEIPLLSEIMLTKFNLCVLYRDNFASKSIDILINRKSTLDVPKHSARIQNGLNV